MAAILAPADVASEGFGATRHDGLRHVTVARRHGCAMSVLPEDFSEFEVMGSRSASYVVVGWAVHDSTLFASAAAGRRSNGLDVSWR